MRFAFTLVLALVWGCSSEDPSCGMPIAVSQHPIDAHQRDAILGGPDDASMVVNACREICWTFDANDRADGGGGDAGVVSGSLVSCSVSTVGGADTVTCSYYRGCR